METSTLRVVILFEEGFWVGYFERKNCDGHSAARHVFGPEPGVAEFSEFVNGGGFDRLVWTKSRPLGLEAATRVNPKRRIREIARSLDDGRASSKARQIVQEQLEEWAAQRKSERAARRALLKEERYLAGCEQRKRKRRGH